MQKLEQQLDEWFVKKAPFQLPEASKATLVKFMPWLTLAGAILTALAAVNLYRFALWTQDLSNYTNNLGAAYGYAPASSLGPMVWVGLVILALEAVLFFMAFPALKARKKSGWNLLFYVAAANVVYALAYLFADQNIGSFIFSVVSSVIGLYLLFQIRSYYTTAAPRNTTASSSTKQKSAK